MSRSLRCTHCDLPLDEGTERCPRCLRKSTVLDPRAKVRTPGAIEVGDVGEEGEAARASDGPAHVGIRATMLLLGYAVFGPLTWLIIGNQAWLEPRGLWLPGCFAAMALGTMPLRMTFAPPDAPMEAAEAKRHYAWRMVAVLGIAAGLFAAQALAGLLIDDPIAALFLGLLFFLAPILVVPPLIKARREGRSIGDALAGAGKGLGLAVAVVAGVAIISALRAASHPPPKTIFIPSDPKALLDPLDLQGVAVSARWVADERGQRALELSGDGGAFERSMLALVGNVTGKLGELKRDPRASGAVRLVLPARLDTPENRKAAEAEATMLTGALEGARTAQGEPIRVSFVFGEHQAR